MLAERMWLTVFDELIFVLLFSFLIINDHDVFLLSLAVPIDDSLLLMAEFFFFLPNE